MRPVTDNEHAHVHVSVAGRPAGASPVTYDSFSATLPSRTRNTSTPRTCPGLPSRSQW